MTDLNIAIEKIREFNRFYTVFIGILNRNFLDTEYSVTETRILFELFSNTECTANSLVEELQIDKSYMSRILKAFEKQQFITKEVSSNDKRSYIVRLTSKGEAKTKELIEVTNRQIKDLVAPLQTKEIDKVVEAMETITKYFTKNLE